MKKLTKDQQEILLNWKRFLTVENIKEIEFLIEMAEQEFAENRINEHHYISIALNKSKDAFASLRTALSGVGEEENIPFEKAVDRASLKSFDRIEFIKGAKWAHEFITNPKNPE